MLKEDNKDRIFLSTYLLHKDNRIRLPKAIENNLPAVPGKTYFDILYNAKDREIILKLSERTH